MYIALRAFRSIDLSGQPRFVKAGEEVPEAKNWSNTRKYVDRGWITDADGMVDANWARLAAAHVNVSVRPPALTPSGKRMFERAEARARARAEARAHMEARARAREEERAPALLTEEQAHDHAAHLLNKLEREDLESMNKTELVDTARMYGVDANGTKRELRAALLERKLNDGNT